MGVCVCGFAADFPCRTFLQHSRYIAIQPGFPQPAEPPLINLPRSKGDVSAAASAPLREEVSVAWRRERPGSQPGSRSPSPSLPDPGAPSEQLCANRSGSGSADVSGLMPVVPDTGLLGIVAVWFEFSRRCASWKTGCAASFLRCHSKKAGMLRCAEMTCTIRSVTVFSKWIQCVFQHFVSS